MKDANSQQPPVRNIIPITEALKQPPKRHLSAADVELRARFPNAYRIRIAGDIS